MIEGILARKTPFQDRHIIGDIIMRNGKKQGILFFGGLGGGKKVKPNNLEIGKLYRITLKSPIKGDLAQTKEWQVKWSHETIRYHYWKFVLLNLICEIAWNSALPEDDIDGTSDEFNKGLYSVLSNGIFFLEHNKIPINDFHFLCFFLGKYFLDFGIYPQVENCLSCEVNIPRFSPSFFDIEKSGFYCKKCSRPNELSVNVEHLRQTLIQSKTTSWKEFEIGTGEVKNSAEDLKVLINYIYYQLNLPQESFKAVKSIF
tara:strand:+ start:669 stop:1442 length:774 start_codon:yes stop_codon:yes gene_type:complete